MNITKVASGFILCFCMLFMVGESKGFAKSVTLTPGAGWQSGQSVVEKRNQFINTLTVNLNDRYTTMDFGVSSPLQRRSPVTSLAKLHTSEQHHVIGAVNAAFFHMDSGEPAYLLAKNDRIVYLGNGAGADTSYMYKPAAFGVTKDNTAVIDRFQVEATITHRNQTIKVNGYNQERQNNDHVLYTSAYGYGNGKTRTNPFGYEVVIKGLPKNIDTGLSFGETVTGKVTGIRPYGQKTSSTIPKDGYVLSASGSEAAILQNMKIGDSVSIALHINDRWKDAAFILASGPLLVQDGKRNMTISGSSPRATQRTARTAVAVDRTGKKVFMVTVDSKSTKSKGMTLREFADHLVKLGAYRAINLDGGGSTTMAARIPGDRYASLVNVPSDGRQRSVSATLEVVSTAPYGPPKTITVKQSQSNLLVSGSADFAIASALDSYNNVVNPSGYPVEYTVEGNIGRMDKAKFIAEKAGKGYVVVRSGSAVKKVPVTVDAAPAKLSSSISSIHLGKGKSEKITISAFNKAGKQLSFNQNAIKWSVKGNVGKVSGGTFTAGQKEGKGSIIANVSGKTISIPVTVSDKPVVVSSLDSVKQWKAAGVRAKTSLIENKSSLKKGGTGYIGIRYDFTGHKQGVSASYMKPASKLTVPSSPSALTVWAWADAKKHWLRTQIKDRNGKVYTLNFTEEHKLDWKGRWKQLTAVIPKGVAYPISVESIYVAEGSSAKKNKGTIYLDELMAVYK
ncbi:MAG: phosphodiester glycosidase family protein [Bacillus sp. (in: firmicutes)]